MPTGISVHIGLNRVDRDHYGSDLDLKGAENDARAMEAIARSRNYETALLLGSCATSINVINAIRCAAEDLGEGDIFLLTFAGHGSQMPNKEGPFDEPFDETWALYDRFLIDDELLYLWTQFKAGVRIAAVSDSCHSASVLMAPNELMSSAAMLVGAKLLDDVRRLAPTSSPAAPASLDATRSIPHEVSAEIYKSNRDLYARIQQGGVASARFSPIEASALLLAACGDGNKTEDGHPYGVFTRAILDAWDDGAFAGNYFEFWGAVQKVVRSSRSFQQPAFSVIGTANPAFYSSRVFSI